MTDMKPPSADELVGPPPLTLDAEYTLKDFLGKTVDEALQTIEDGGVTEDFAYMTSVGIAYYLPAALQYLEGEDSRDDWEFAHGLLCSLSCLIELDGLEGPGLPILRQVSEYCDQHRAKFDMTGENDLSHEYLRVIRGGQRTV
jgi:hypothetical protein